VPRAEAYVETMVSAHCAAGSGGARELKPELTREKSTERAETPVQDSAIGRVVVRAASAVAYARLNSRPWLRTPPPAPGPSFNVGDVAHRYHHGDDEGIPGPPSSTTSRCTQPKYPPRNGGLVVRAGGWTGRRARGR